MPTWPHAEIVADPIPAKQLTEPRLLVRRRLSNLVDSHGCQLDILTGHPVISLFTGVGGMDLGCEMAGFRTVVQVEMDETCCQTLIANRPQCFEHSALLQADICKTNTSAILSAAGLSVGQADLLVGGPPCQGFSTSGKRRVDDPRNDLVYEFLRVVDEAKPTFFIFENVPGFQTLGGGDYFEGFLRRAHHCYYKLVYGMLQASEYGVPQDRVRFFCMGTRRDVAEGKGIIAALPGPRFFAPRDLKLIRSLEAGPLFKDQLDRVCQAPGILYFPDRPVLRAPSPSAHRGGRDPGRCRSKTYMEFYARLKRDEPDRIVEAAQTGHRDLMPQQPGDPYGSHSERR